MNKQKQKCSITKADRQQKQFFKDERNRNTQLIYIYRDFAKADTFSYKCIHQTADHGYKSQDGTSIVDSLEISQSCVKITCEMK